MKKIKYYIPKVKVSSYDNHGNRLWSRPINVTCHTNGKGWWSRTAKAVPHKKMQLKSFGSIGYDDDIEFIYSFYELRVFFPKKNWDVKKYGLIYTDNLWMKEFRQGLINMGFSRAAVKDCDYSEQGMQSNDYVSLDAGPIFAKDFFEKLYNK